MVGGPYGTPFAPGWSLFYGPTGNTFFPLGPVNWPNNDASLGLQTLWGRNTVVNVHIGIPHRNDAGRDDIQLLYNNEALKNQFYYGANDMASSFCTGSAAVSGPACMYAINGETLSTLRWSRSVWDVGTGDVHECLHLGLLVVHRQDV